MNHRIEIAEGGRAQVVEVFGKEPLGIGVSHHRRDPGGHEHRRGVVGGLSDERERVRPLGIDVELEQGSKRGHHLSTGLLGRRLGRLEHGIRWLRSGPREPPLAHRAHHPAGDGSVDGVEQSSRVTNEGGGVARIVERVGVGGHSDHACRMSSQRVEPGPGQESVWDYPRPPRLEPTTRHLLVMLGGTTIADTRQGHRVLETSQPPAYYLDPADVRVDLLEPSTRRTFCEWKG